MLSQHISLIK